MATKKNPHTNRNRTATKGLLKNGGKKVLPGFKGKRAADGKKRIAKVAKNRLKDALSPSSFDVPVVRDAAKPPSHDDPPDYLNADGIYMWKLVGTAIAKVGELNRDHLSGLTGLSYLHQRMQHKMKLQMDIPHQEFGQYLKYLMQYGLTPISGQALDPENKRRERPTPFIEPAPEDTPTDSFKSLRQGANDE